MSMLYPMGVLIPITLANIYCTAYRVHRSLCAKCVRNASDDGRMIRGHDGCDDGDPRVLLTSIHLPHTVPELGLGRMGVLGV